MEPLGGRGHSMGTLPAAGGVGDIIGNDGDGMAGRIFLSLSSREGISQPFSHLYSAPL